MLPSAAKGTSTANEQGKTRGLPVFPTRWQHLTYLWRVVFRKEDRKYCSERQFNEFLQLIDIKRAGLKKQIVQRKKLVSVYGISHFDAQHEQQSANWIASANLQFFVTDLKWGSAPASRASSGQGLDGGWLAEHSYHSWALEQGL